MYFSSQPPSSCPAFSNLHHLSFFVLFLFFPLIFIFICRFNLLVVLSVSALYPLTHLGPLLVSSAFCLLHSSFLLSLAAAVEGGTTARRATATGGTNTRRVRGARRAKRLAMISVPTRRTRRPWSRGAPPHSPSLFRFSLEQTRRKREYEKVTSLNPQHHFRADREREVLVLIGVSAASSSSPSGAPTVH